MADEHNPAMSKPRLLISTDAYLPRWDGVSRFLSEVIPLLQHKFDITVLAPAFEGTAPEMAGVKVVRQQLIPWRFGDIKFAWPNKKVVRELVGKADIIFNQSIGPIGIRTIREATRQRKPVLSYIHVIEWEIAAKSIRHFRRISALITKRVARRLYNKCRLLLVSGSDIGMLLQAAGVTTPHVIVPLGVDTKRFAPAHTKEKAKVDVGINPNLKVIGFVGRIAREKDLPTLQQAFNIVHKEQKDTALLIVGGGVRGEVQPGEGVIITGVQENVIPYLQAIDVFVLPSLTETTSLATMEAMSCALPVIVTPVGNIPDYVKHEWNGWFFARHDAEDLARKITYLLERPALRSSLGVNARLTVTQHFTWELTAKRLSNLLHEVLEGKKIEIYQSGASQQTTEIKKPEENKEKK
jgi:glycosyltransferase involved in cell wall biosynthesis